MRHSPSRGNINPAPKNDSRGAEEQRSRGEPLPPCSPAPLLPCRISLWQVFALAGVCIAAAAWSVQAEVWVIGRGGISWEAGADIAAGVDVRDPVVLSPTGFSEEDNVTQAIQWVDAPTEDFLAEGKGHIWDNAAMLGSDLVLVDGDSTTSTGERFKVFGVNQTGRIFFMDLGASFPASQIVFFPSPEEKGAFIRSFEVSINDGRDYGKDGTPIYQIVRQVELNRDWRVEVAFPTQLLRFVKLRVLSSNPFEIAELQVHGEGFVPRGTYVSKLIQLPRPVNYGTLAFRATKVRRGPGGMLYSEPAARARVTVQMKNGIDDTPLVYYKIVDVETGAEEETTKEEYDKLQETLKGAIREDLTHWSPWTEPLRADSSGVYTTLLELPGPRQYFQFGLLFEGSTTDAIQVDSLAITYSPPLAEGALGEVALLSEPNPPGGIAAVPAGADTILTYDVRVDLGSPPQGGFDGVRIETPSRPRFLKLEMGNPLVEVEPDSVRVDPDGLRVYFPSHRISRGRDERLRVTFGTTLLLYSTVFGGQLLDTRGRLPQAIREGDASEDVGTNALRVVFSGGAEDVLNALDVVPPVITPNGDGRNDQAVFSYVIVHLVQPAPTTVELYDSSGRPVRELFSGPLYAGRYEQRWDGTDAEGKTVPPGTYMVKVSVGAEEGETSRVRVVNVVY